MAQKVVGYVKFQVPAGKATPAPPVGPALGQYGINIGQFTKDFNDRTKNDIGMMIPVVITVYADRTFSFITKTPPTALLIKKELACFRRSPARQGRHTQPRVPAQDRRNQDARSQLHRYRVRNEHGCRHLPQHGRSRSSGVIHPLFPQVGGYLFGYLPNHTTRRIN